LTQRNVFARQPLITTATLAAVVSAVLNALTAFGVPLTVDQQSAISGLADVLGPFVVALVGQCVLARVTGPPGDVGLLGPGGQLGDAGPARPGGQLGDDE
jgi:hypothetical protein